MNIPRMHRPLATVLFALLMSLVLPVEAGDFFTRVFSAVRPDVPYIPTRYSVVDGMLKLAQVNKDDVVYDLGCGDGRIVIAAARTYGARGVGIDLNPWRIAEARDNARFARVEDRVSFVKDDIFNVDFSEATVVMLYLLPEVNQELRPKLWKQLRVGARVVSHDYDMGHEWLPEKTENVGGKTIYYWTIRAEHKKEGKT